MCFHWIQVNSFHFSVAKNHSEENRKLDFSKFRSLCFRFGFYRSFWWAIHTNCVFCTQLNDCSISWSKYFGLFVFSWSKSSILDVVQCIGDGTKRSTTLNPFHSGGKFKKKKTFACARKELTSHSIDSFRFEWKSTYSQCQNRVANWFFFSSLWDFAYNSEMTVLNENENEKRQIAERSVNEKWLQ